MEQKNPLGNLHTNLQMMIIQKMENGSLMEHTNGNFLEEQVSRDILVAVRINWVISLKKDYGFICVKTVTKNYHRI